MLRSTMFRWHVVQHLLIGTFTVTCNMTRYHQTNTFWQLCLVSTIWPASQIAGQTLLDIAIKIVTLVGIILAWLSVQMWLCSSQVWWTLSSVTYTHTNDYTCKLLGFVALSRLLCFVLYCSNNWIKLHWFLNGVGLWIRWTTIFVVYISFF